jgi:hypothetical protein
MKWKFKKSAYPQGKGEFWYDITNGYINLSEVIADKKQLKSLNDAVALIESFEQALSDADLLNEI